MTLTSAFAGRVPISDFVSLVGIALDVVSSALTIKSCVITAGIKKYKSIIIKRKNKHDKIISLKVS